MMMEISAHLRRRRQAVEPRRGPRVRSGVPASADGVASRSSWTRTTRVVTEVKSPAALDLFQSSGTVVLEEGWKLLDIRTRTDKTAASKRDAEDDDVILPQGLSVDQEREVTRADRLDKKTSPPKRFNRRFSAHGDGDGGQEPGRPGAGRGDARSGARHARHARGGPRDHLLTRGYVVREAVATPKGVCADRGCAREGPQPGHDRGMGARVAQRIAARDETLPDFMTRINEFVKDVVREALELRWRNARRHQESASSGPTGNRTAPAATRPARPARPIDDTIASSPGESATPTSLTSSFAIGFTSRRSGRIRRRPAGRSSRVTTRWW